MFHPFNFITDLLSSGGGAVFAICLILGAIVVLHALSPKLIRKVVQAVITPDALAPPDAEQKREETLIRVISSIARVAVWVFGGMLVLSQAGVSVAPLIAGGSIVGIAVGFGAQSFIQDFVAGLFIVIENRYRVGDYVTTAGHSGVVELVGMRQTILRSSDGSKHFIANSQTTNVTNHSMDFSNVVLRLGVGYDADLDKVEKIVNQIGDKIKKSKKYAKVIIETPKFVCIDDFASDSVIIKIKGVTVPGHHRFILRELRREIKEAFDKNGIDIPYPQMVIHQVPPKRKQSDKQP